jgi:predicted nucleic acid-binding protein
VKKPVKSLPDTDSIVRYLVGDDPVLSVKAKEFFEKLKNGDVKAVILESIISPHRKEIL